MQSPNPLHAHLAGQLMSLIPAHTRLAAHCLMPGSLGPAGTEETPTPTLSPTPTQLYSLEEVLHFLRHLPGRIAVAPLPQQRAANTTQAEWGARKCTQLQMQFRPDSRAAGTAAGQPRSAQATSQVKKPDMLHNKPSHYHAPRLTGTC